MSIVLIDNYDSFTYNLYQLLSMIAADDVRVLRNDDRKGWEEIQRDTLDAVVISPGPGRPEVPADFGISSCGLEAGVPVLGVCLGLQGMCYTEGGTVDLAPEPYHGRTSPVIHDGSELFAGIPSPLRVVRYHSLVVSEVPPAFHVTAWTETQDGRRLVMAVRHRMRPVWGVQFHPESIFTEYGQRIVENFVTLSGARRKPGRIAPSAVSVRTLPVRRVDTHRNGLPEVGKTGRAGSAPAAPDGQVRAEDGGMTLMWHEHQGIPDAETTYERLFAVGDRAFWLDSSAVIRGLSRLSVLGGAGPAAEYVTAVATKGVDVQAADGSTRHHDCSIFDYLESELRKRRIPAASLPFDFNLGYVGYLGYELKAECGGDAAHDSDIPDAALIFCDRAVVIDHEAERTYSLTLVKNGAEECGRRWLDNARMVLAGAGTTARGPASPAARVELDVTLRSSPAEYARLVRECLSEIRQGETYEVCLTNTITTRRPPDPWETYRDLRRRNPAPYGALLRFPDVQVLSASPERFLRIDRDGRVEAKPIKGTRPRGQTREEDEALAAELRCSEKDRAENLMIVDLLRNDLGKVSETGSVHVPVIFDVEAYATVHQLVTTVRSRLRAGVSPVACVRAAFPGGSMTGAPKRRTMQIIDRLEGASRGVYSGALGYFALSGAVDLSIVIRTIVVAGESARVGAGGAVVALSDPDDEVAEMQLKARASLDALRATADAADMRLVTASGAPSHPAADQTPSGLPFAPWPGKDHQEASR